MSILLKLPSKQSSYVLQHIQIIIDTWEFGEIYVYAAIKTTNKDY